MSALPSSFRDPSGFVFQHEDSIYRQVNDCYAKTFEHFLESGLYNELISKKLLVSHTEVSNSAIPATETAYKLLKPEQVAYISYPYEWSFSQLKDAAILTLRIQALALRRGFSLKDASAFNVQFVDSRPIFIDTLSFEPYRDGMTWSAYRQFCQHFLTPLALMTHADIELGKLLMLHIDGIPLSLASKLLPMRTRLSYGLQVHIHLHARLQASYADIAGTRAGAGAQQKKIRAESIHISLKGLERIVDSLANTVHSLKWKPPTTEWSNYYSDTNYSQHANQHKRKLVGSLLESIEDRLKIVQDFGSNTGEFSRIAARYSEVVISQDIDPAAVEANYRRCKAENPRNILPLVQNLFSPSPAIGWANEERESFRQRAQCDLILALALIHHLSITNNLPMTLVAELFASLAKWLVIEFVPKTDSQVIRLLETREDIFSEYTQRGFESAFSSYFEIVERRPLEDSERTLYLMQSSRK